MESLLTTEVAPLSKVERARFQKLDKAVQSGIGAFVVVGMALKEIRDSKLYRDHYRTFEEYVQERHDISRRRGYELIDAAETVHHLEVCANCAQTPANEGQCRALADLPLDQRAAAWEEVVQRSEETGERITARLIASVVGQDSQRQSRAASRITASDLDKRITKLEEAFRGLPSRKLQEAFVDKLQHLVSELEEWLER